MLVSNVSLLDGHIMTISMSLNSKSAKRILVYVFSTHGMYACVYVCMHVCMECLDVYMCMYVCVLACMHACIFV